MDAPATLLLWFSGIVAAIFVLFLSRALFLWFFGITDLISRLDQANAHLAAIRGIDENLPTDKGRVVVPPPKN